MTATTKQQLFNYLANEHDVLLLEGDFNEIDVILEKEMCKWEKQKEGGYLAECDDEYGIPFANIIVYHFNYCPFCGRKIERT